MKVQACRLHASPCVYYTELYYRHLYVHTCMYMAITQVGSNQLQHGAGSNNWGQGMQLAVLVL